ncbi:7-methylguanosine phosphate-specific 5'-nucleotidase A isoform X1 [Tanacetum coccineum]
MERDIPVLIFLAGLADIIEEVLHQKLHRTFKNVKIVSNGMKFDQNCNLLSFTGKLIHSLNKNEHALGMAVSLHDHLGEVDDQMIDSASVKMRTNVLLLGDHIGDLRMSDGLNYETRIYVGFLNHKGYDIVIQLSPYEPDHVELDCLNYIHAKLCAARPNQAHKLQEAPMGDRCMSYQERPIMASAPQIYYSDKGVSMKKVKEHLKSKALISLFVDKLKLLDCLKNTNIQDESYADGFMKHWLGTSLSVVRACRHNVAAKCAIITLGIHLDHICTLDIRYMDTDHLFTLDHLFGVDQLFTSGYSLLGIFL